MGSVDVLWLNMDRPTNLMVIVSVVLLESVPDWDLVLDVLRERLLAKYPVFTERARRPRGPFGRYRWEPDPDFDLAHHVHRATLTGPATDGDALLQAYVEEHLPRPFDHTRPLWEVHLVEGPGAGAAVVFRSHHSLADGIALTRVLLGLTDGPDGRPGDLVGPPAPPDLVTGPLAPPHVAPQPRPVTTGVQLARRLAAAARDRLQRKGARAAVTDAAGFALRTGQVVSDLLLTTNPTSAVGGVPGQRKRVVWTGPLPLTGLRQAGHLVGATLNDVLVSAVAGALHAYQVERGREPVDLVTMVPVNLRPLDEPLPRTLGNRFALVFLRFPSRDATPLGRLALSKARMDWLKASPEAALTYALITVMGLTSRAVERRLVDFFANKAIGVTTNVAGPRDLRSLAGVPVTGLLGWVPGSGKQTLGFCIVTYNGAVRIGIMADESIIPEPEPLLAALEDEIALLVRIGAAAPAPHRRRGHRS